LLKKKRKKKNNFTLINLKRKGSVLPAPIILDSSRGQQTPAGHILDITGSPQTAM